MYYKLNAQGFYILPSHFTDDGLKISSYGIVSKEGGKVSPLAYLFVMEFPFSLVPDIASYNNGKTYEMALWCEENTDNDWLISMQYAAFENELDALGFKLRWL